MSPLALLVEAATAILREARRIVPMAAGIVWGVASVFVLVAIGRGFEATQRAELEALGDSFLLLRVNRVTSSRGDLRSNAFVALEPEDVEAMREHSPHVAALSPKASHWFLSAWRGQRLMRATAVGVDPEYADIVRLPLVPGSRWLDANDLGQELPVCVLGHGVRAELFGEESPIGEEIRLIFQRDAGEDSIVRRLRVVGALADSELAGDTIYVSHRNAILMPYTSWERMSAEPFQFFVLRPTRPEDKDLALAEVRAVLGARHGFDASIESTLVPYFDAIERKQKIDALFGGLELFLTAVGALILLLGAVGVANVVLMSVSARTFEFGLRRALGCRRRWIFAQVFLEATAVCVLSGALGFLCGVLGVELLARAPLPAGFAPPKVELGAAVLPGLLLLATSLAAAAWPAARAARVRVVLALRGGRA